jgi:hypothetical protein
MAQKIYLKNGKPFPESQALSISEGDTVRWISRDTGYFIDFGTDSPFNHLTYEVHAHASKGSGVIVNTTGDYPYTLTQIVRGKRKKKRHSKKKILKLMSFSAGGPDVEILP